MTFSLPFSRDKIAENTRGWWLESKLKLNSQVRQGEDPSGIATNTSRLLSPAEMFTCCAAQPLQAPVCGASASQLHLLRQVSGFVAET